MLMYDSGYHHGSSLKLGPSDVERGDPECARGQLSQRRVHWAFANLILCDVIDVVF